MRVTGGQRAARAAVCAAMLVVAIVGASSVGAAAHSRAVGVKPVAQIPVTAGQFPTILASAFGSIWVAAHRGNFVYRISPRTNKKIASILVGSNTCGLEAYHGHMLATDCDTNVATSIDPRTNKIVHGIQLTTDYDGAGSVWSSSPGNTDIVRRDPKTHVVLKRWPTLIEDPTMSVLAGYAFGSAWVMNQTEIDRIDGATNAVTEIPLPGSRDSPGPGQGFAASADLVFLHGKVWVGNPSGLYEIDTSTNKATLHRIHIGDLSQWGDISLTSAHGSLWARTAGNVVSRIDPATGKVIGTYPASGGGGWIVLTGNSLWIANAGDDDVWRETIKPTT